MDSVEWYVVKRRSNLKHMFRAMIPGSVSRHVYIFSLRFFRIVVWPAPRNFNRKVKIRVEGDGQKNSSHNNIEIIVFPFFQTKKKYMTFEHYCVNFNSLYIKQYKTAN